MGSEGDEEEDAMAEIGSAVYPYQSSVEATMRGATGGGRLLRHLERAPLLDVDTVEGWAQSCLACCTLGQWAEMKRMIEVGSVVYPPRLLPRRRM